MLNVLKESGLELLITPPEFRKIKETWILIKTFAGNSMNYLDSAIHIKYMPYENQLQAIFIEGESYIKKKQA